MTTNPFETVVAPEPEAPRSDEELVARARELSNMDREATARAEDALLPERAGFGSGIERANQREEIDRRDEAPRGRFSFTGGERLKAPESPFTSSAELGLPDSRHGLGVVGRGVVAAVKQFPQKAGELLGDYRPGERDETSPIGEKSAKMGLVPLGVGGTAATVARTLSTNFEKITEAAASTPRGRAMVNHHKSVDAHLTDLESKIKATEDAIKNTPELATGEVVAHLDAGRNMAKQLAAHKADVEAKLLEHLGMSPQSGFDVSSFGAGEGAKGHPPIAALKDAYRKSGNTEWEALADAKYAEMQTERAATGYANAKNTAAAVSKAGTPEAESIDRLAKTASNSRLRDFAEDAAAWELYNKRLSGKDFRLAGRDEDTGEVLSAFGTGPKRAERPLPSGWSREQRTALEKMVVDNPDMPAKEIMRAFYKEHGEVGPGNLIPTISKIRTGYEQVSRAKPRPAPAPERSFATPALREPLDLEGLKTPSDFAAKYFRVMEPAAGESVNLEAGKAISDHAMKVLSESQFNQFVRELNKLKSGAQERPSGFGKKGGPEVSATTGHPYLDSRDLDNSEAPKNPFNLNLERLREQGDQRDQYFKGRDDERGTKGKPPVPQAPMPAPGNRVTSAPVDEAPPKDVEMDLQDIRARGQQRNENQQHEDIMRRFQGKPPVPEVPAPAKGNRIAQVDGGPFNKASGVTSVKKGDVAESEAARWASVDPVIRKELNNDSSPTLGRDLALKYPDKLEDVLTALSHRKLELLFKGETTRWKHVDKQWDAALETYVQRKRDESVLRRKGGQGAGP